MLIRIIRAIICIARSKAFTSSVLAVAVVSGIYQTTEEASPYYLRNGEQMTFVHTMAVTGNVSEEEELSSSILVTLKADKREYTMKVPQGATVEDLLDEKRLKLDGNDLINMDVDEILYDNAAVVIERIDYAVRTEERILPYETLQTESSLLRPGKKEVIVSGKAGKEVTTYVQKLKDGEVIFERAVDSTVVEEPVAQEEIIGAYTAISPFDFDCESDENGVPLEYVTVYRNQKATGYSARDGALTASGRYAIPGHVAVDSEKIPYGTKLYIASPDNTFIYGYAIAADTGIGLMDGRTDVDLFYDSYAESVLNGVRYVDIYILE